MSLLLSQLVSIRVPISPLECAQLGMSHTIFHDTYIREAFGDSSCAPPIVCWALHQIFESRARAENPDDGDVCKSLI